MNPYHMMFLVAFYISTVCVLVCFMKFRAKPFALSRPRVIYNALMTALSGYMCVEILNQAFIKNKYVFGHNGMDKTENGDEVSYRKLDVVFLNIIPSLI